MRSVAFQELIDEGLLEIGDGYRAQNSELGGNGPIFLRAGHITDTHIDFMGVERFHESLAAKVRSKMSQVGDTVITTKGNSTGRTSFVTQGLSPFVYSPHLSYWRSRNPSRLCPGFLRYWSKSLEFRHQLSAMKTSTDMAPYLSLTDQRRLRITLPPAADQKIAAAVLSALDDKIGLNRRMNATLEAMARALFQSWFVDFDPVHAKREGHATGLPHYIDAMFPAGFQDSPIGRVPIGWNVEPFKTHLQTARGLSYGGDGLREDRTGLPMHNLNSVYEGGGYKHEGIKYYDGEYRERHLLKAGDLIVINTEQGFDHRLIGHAAIVPDCFGTVGLFSHHVYRVLPRPTSTFTPHYLVQLFNNLRWHYWISGFSNGTTINMLPIDALEMPMLVVPPQGLVAWFTNLAADIHAKSEANLAESRTLATLRDTLLPKLLSGEIRLKS